MARRKRAPRRCRSGPPESHSRWRGARPEASRRGAREAAASSHSPRRSAATGRPLPLQRLRKPEGEHSECVNSAPTAMNGRRRPNRLRLRSLKCPTIGWTRRPVSGAAIHSIGKSATPAPSVWNMRLVETFWRPHTTWVPNRPRWRRGSSGGFGRGPPNARLPPLSSAKSFVLHTRTQVLHFREPMSGEIGKTTMEDLAASPGSRSPPCRARSTMRRSSAPAPSSGSGRWPRSMIIRCQSMAARHSAQRAPWRSSRPT